MPRPGMLAVLALTCACAANGCAALAKKPPTPADDISPRQAAAVQAGPGERYFVLVFGSQSTPKRAKYTHSWATIVKVTDGPGGPKVEEQALKGYAARFALPRPMLNRPHADFSLSGLKTALRLEAEKIAPLSDENVSDLCASFQAAVVDVVEDRIRVGLKLFRQRIGVAPRAVVVAGGVAANAALREALTRFCAEAGLPLVAPPQKLCTDNGAMIAWVGVERLRLGMIDGLDAPGRPRWPLDAKSERTLNNKA